jgi:HAD superfamily hydrolase (TIGR01549 family)
MTLEAIFFDVGGTLVFPDQQRTLEPLHAAGIIPTATQLGAAERAARMAIDRDLSAHAPNAVDRNYWDHYYSELLRQVEVSSGEMKRELIRRARTSSNWNRLAPDTPELLDQLKRHYRLGIISNSDGGIAALLRQLELEPFFDAVTDSGKVGHQKPDARIFQAALQTLGVDARASVYVGDIYTVDYLGATGAGMQAILMDTAAVYGGSSHERVQSLRELAERLA